MRIFKSHPLLKLVNAYMVDSPQPSNISYLWNFGSLLGLCLVIQIITGVTLAMHYNSSVLEAFNSVEHIMRDVNNGWLIRYLHSNTASAFFFLVYLHIGRGLYFGSYRAPRTLVWTIGTVIFLLMIVTAFLGYVLPYGQMSLWGATVITNLMSAIPWIGQDIVEFLWGGFSVNNATLNRFFSLHFVLPFILAALVIMHLIALHDSAGSGNPLGISGNYDRLPFAPYFLFKDLITIFIFIIVLSIFVFFMPNVLGDSENYVMANPMQTPPAIVPEWYLLPFYAILRSIPNKLLGVIAMLSAILMLLTLPFADLSRSRGIQFRPLSKIAFYVFIANFLILMVLGAKHVESPYIEFGQISTVLYFGHFLIVMPLVSLFENSLIELDTNKDEFVSNHIIKSNSGASIFTLILITVTSTDVMVEVSSNIGSILEPVGTSIIEGSCTLGSKLLGVGFEFLSKSIPFIADKITDAALSNSIPFIADKVTDAALSKSIPFIADKVTITDTALDLIVNPVRQLEGLLGNPAEVPLFVPQLTDMPFQIDGRLMEQVLLIPPMEMPLPVGSNPFLFAAFTNITEALVNFIQSRTDDIRLIWTSHDWLQSEALANGWVITQNIIADHIQHMQAPIDLGRSVSNILSLNIGLAARALGDHSAMWMNDVYPAQFIYDRMVGYYNYQMRELDIAQEYVTNLIEAFNRNRNR